MRHFSLKTRFCQVSCKIQTLYALLRQYQTLPLLFRVYPANSTTLILFCRVKICTYYSVNTAFLTNLFIWTNKDPKFCHIFTLRKNFIKTLQALGSFATQETRVLEALWHLRHSSTQGTWALAYLRHFIQQMPGYSIHRHFDNVC